MDAGTGGPPQSRGARFWLLAVVPPLLLVPLVLIMVPAVLESTGARFLGGEPGTFVVDQVECRSSCSAYGVFLPTSGERGTPTDWGGPTYGIAVGDRFAAVLPEDGQTAYPDGEGWGWLGALVVLAILVTLLVRWALWLRGQLSPKPDGPLPGDVVDD